MSNVSNMKHDMRKFHFLILRRNDRIGVVASAVWLICVFSYELRQEGSFDSDFFVMFALWGVLPLVLAWGIRWIFQAERDNKSDQTNQRDRAASTQGQTTLYDKSMEIASKAVIRGYRQIANQRDCAPTAKTSDAKIVEVYGKVIRAFHNAAKEQQQIIPAVQLNFIALKFFQVYEIGGDAMLDEHLHYEINKYKTSGLREEYKQELKLF